MSQRHLLVTVAVAVICTAILTLFTDVETSLLRWWNCGSSATATEKASKLCR